jgi:hypothetical protein
VKKKARILRSFGQGLCHLHSCLRQAAIGLERPSQGVVREDICPRIQLALRKLERQWRLESARGEINRKGTRVFGDAAFLELVFDGRGLRGFAQETQRVGQKPLGLGQMIQGCCLLERFDGSVGFPDSEFNSSEGKECRRAVGLRL